jgi:hypothetical protein
MAAHRLNDCYNSCEINYGNRLQQTKKNITEYEQSHKNGYSIEEIETYNNLQNDFDVIMTNYHTVGTIVINKPLADLVQRFVVAIKVKQKDDKHIVRAVVIIVVVAVLAGIVSSKIAIIIFLYVCIII